MKFHNAVLSLTLCISSVSVHANDMGDLIKQRVQEKIAAKLDTSGPRLINNTNNVSGTDNAANASADGAQNVSINYREGAITYTDSRQWHDRHDATTTTTDSRRWEDSFNITTTNTPQYHTHPAPVANPYLPTRFVARPIVDTVQPARLTYTSLVDCPDRIAIRCWAPCGGYFIDAEGRRFNLLPSYSKVAYEYRYDTLPGHYSRTSSGTLFYTAYWGNTIRTFSYAGL